jgi:hypothetical protein
MSGEKLASRAVRPGVSAATVLPRGIGKMDEEHGDFD